LYDWPNVSLVKRMAIEVLPTVPSPSRMILYCSISSSSLSLIVPPAVPACPPAALLVFPSETEVTAGVTVQTALLLNF
jgi:hypothetical protein